MYDTSGNRIRSLQEFEDGKGYVLTSGEPYKNIDYVLPLQRPRFNANSKENLNIPELNDNPIVERHRARKVNSIPDLLGQDMNNKGSEIALFDPTVLLFSHRQKHSKLQSMRMVTQILRD